MPNQTDSQDYTDRQIEHSPLERDITRDDATVRICIYRVREDPGWLLEIEDERGGSTCWNDLFESDQAALEEALRCIDDQGIRSFCDVRRDPISMRALWNLATSQPDIADLKSILASSGKMSSFIMHAVSSPLSPQRRGYLCI